MVLRVVLCLLIVLLSGCASLGKREAVFALVNGEPIRESDLAYSLNIAHRREDLSSTKAVDILHYVQKLIDDRLVIQEAYRTDIEKLPEIQQALKAYILRESVVRLHNDEIVQKVSVTDGEAKAYYKKNSELFTLGIIELSAEEAAKEALKQLKDGGDFKETAQKISEHASKKDGGEITLAWQGMGPDLQEAVLKLKPNELSDVVSLNKKFYIMKLIGRKEAPGEDFEKAKDGITKTLRKKKEQERGDAYLKALRGQGAVKVNRDALASIKLEGDGEAAEKMLADKTALAEVNGSVLTVGEFIPMLKGRRHVSDSDMEKAKEDTVNGWIDFKVVDSEALRRHYEQNSDLKDMLENYKDQLMKNTFIKKVIIPKITISETMLKDYYASHKKDFLKPNKYRIQQITVKTPEDANKILDSLKGGDDFAWLAKRKSTDPSKENGGDIGWVTKNELPAPVAGVVDTLKPGELSPAVDIGSQYRVVRLLGRTEDEAEEFYNVKESITRACFTMKFKEIFDDYAARLKKDADIKIYDDAIKDFEQRFQQ